MQDFAISILLEFNIGEANIEKSGYSMFPFCGSVKVNIHAQGEMLRCAGCDLPSMTVQAAWS